MHAYSHKYTDYTHTHTHTYIYIYIQMNRSTKRFISLRVFGLLSSSLLLFPQCFGRYVPRPSSGVCRTREPSRNFELLPLLNPRESSVSHNQVQELSIPAVRIEPATFR